jgi:thiamine pyrophosphokinase
VCGGDSPGPELLRRELQRADVVLCTDGVAAWLEAQGVVADAVVGDMDSLGDAPVQAPLLDAGPHEAQENSDSEKALRLALERGAAEVVLLGATGGRLDHTLGNVALCAAYWRQARVRLLGGGEVLEVTGATWEGDVRRGARVSIIALTPDVVVRTQGLRWELDEPLEYGTRGMSNVAAAGVVRIEVRAGLVAIITPDGAD